MNEAFLKKITILIVEDNQDDLSLLVKTLNKYFNTILTATNGLEALKVYKEHEEIDIIISKIEMEKMNGIELLKSIRFSDLYLPFIIISSKNDSDILMDAVNLNVSSFIPKPLDIPKLLERIDIVCEKKYFEYRLKRKQEELNRYISSVDKVAVIFRLKRDGTITYMNDAMLDVSGYTKEELGEINFNDLLHPDIPKKIIDETWNELESGKIWRGNTKFKSKKDETFYLNNTIFKSIDEDDEYITIAFLTTQENLEKRDFHKKVLMSIKEFNLKEFNYKKQIQSLERQIANFDVGVYENKIKTLKEKIASHEIQEKKYKSDIDMLNDKYQNMLMSKKDEISRYVDLIQIEKNKNQKLETQIEKLKEEENILREINERMISESKRRGI